MMACLTTVLIGFAMVWYWTHKWRQQKDHGADFVDDRSHDDLNAMAGEPGSSQSEDSEDEGFEVIGGETSDIAVDEVTNRKASSATEEENQPEQKEETKSVFLVEEDAEVRSHGGRV